MKPHLLPIILLSLAFLPETHAQILNTLRGWSDIDNGWSVEVEGKFSLSRGNYHHMDLSSHGAVQYLTERNRFRFMISENFYNIDGNTVSEDFVAHLRHNYRLTNTFATLLFTQDQYKPYQSLQRRTLLGGGLRADILHSDRCGAALGASAMMESLAFTNEINEEDTTNIRASFFISLLWQPVDVLTIDLSGFYQPKLPDFAEPLLMSALCLETRLSQYLSMINTFDLAYDESPAEGVDQTDYSLKSGLRFSL